MMMKKNILKTVHESAKSLYDAGLVNITTMREFDALCLPPIKDLSPSEIKKIRIRQKVSQPIFARILNVSPSTVKHWESGGKHPSGAALKLLNVIFQRGMHVVM
jgi:putative transcriptional regulator